MTRRDAGARLARTIADPGVAAVAGVVVLGLVLRLWGIRTGLPVAYNLDERSHFVPRAVAFFADGSLNPSYQLNPSGLIEWIAAALTLAHRSRSGVVDAWQQDPGAVWLVARVAAALLASSAIALLAVAGSRLFDRRVGISAAALLATAFLPAHYGHLALNDAPSLAPTCLALVGIAGILTHGRPRDHALAGFAAGVAIGFKYNAAFVLLPIATAAAVHAIGHRDHGRSIAIARGGAIAAAALLAGLVITDPYAFLEPQALLRDLRHLGDYTSGGLLLGETQRSGYRYYLWSLSWGFGVVPLALALAGSVMLVARDRVRALVLLPAAALFLLSIGHQGRYFARYVMPIFPVLALLAAAALVALADRLSLSPQRRRVAVVCLTTLACAQGLVQVVHNDIVLSRADTRTQARDWMVDHIPARTRILVEPIVPQEWYRDGGLPGSSTSQQGYRWRRLVRTRRDIARLSREFPGARNNADFANYVSTLFPGLLRFYRSRGVCWVVSGSTQSGRAFNDPPRVPQAIAYYRALEREADVAFEVSPFGPPGTGPQHYFQYDKAFDYEPLRYRRPGPRVVVYRLRDCTPA